MMARSTKGSNQRPDTLMQDRTAVVSIKVLLQRTAGPYIGVSGARAKFDPQVTAFCPAQIPESTPECCHLGLLSRIVFRKARQYADQPCPTLLLRARRDRRAPEQCDELATPHGAYPKAKDREL